ncbi:MAG: hypothetical protein M3552_01605 [Planctomycetota bacterium]|nr:hypothetical protein [Planctomycetaceae bacterium]MDQ3329342.1 hypothetical protein [Planctomycetota bacterium]
MPHWVPVVSQVRRNIPHVSSTEVYPSYYRRRFYGEWEEDLYAGTNYMVKIERKSGSTWTTVDTIYFTYNP